jgi:uncharacterized membrane protein (DUF373 family)
MDGGGGGKKAAQRTVAVFGLSETILHGGVAAVLVVVAAAALINTAAHLKFSGQGFLPGVIAAINGVLLVVIVLEILRTVLAHFAEGGFPLREFLVIGIISATRHILTIAVQLTVSEGTRSAITLSLWGLIASTGVVVGLVFALFLVSKTGE